MRVLYIHQYYNIPENGGPLRSWHISQALSNAGHEVELITAHNERNYKRASHGKVIVHYLPVPYDNSYGTIKRIASFLKFVFQAIQLSSKIKADICFASSTPLTIGLIALYLKMIKSLPYIFEVRDLWPEAPIQMGVIKSSFLQKLLLGLEKKIYRNANSIIALSPGMQSGIEAKITRSQIHVIPNMADCDYFQPVDEKSDEVVRKFNAIGRFVISYIGTAGKANDLFQLLDTAKVFQKHCPQVLFIIAAKGGELEKIQNRAVASGLNNVKFVPYLQREELRELLSLSDFTYLSFAQKPVLETSSPNKLFDSLAAGVPVISNINGWWVELLEKEGAGLLYSPENITQMVQYIEPFVKDVELLHSYKKNARKLAEKYFDKDSLSKKIVKVIEEEK